MADDEFGPGLGGGWGLPGRCGRKARCEDVGVLVREGRKRGQEGP